MWTAEVLTLYARSFPAHLGDSLIGRARDEGLWNLRVIDIRDYGLGRHRRVDDSPYGGGGGMVLRADVLHSAMASVSLPNRIYLSARGRRLRQADINRWSSLPGLVLLCGHFEGVDQRFIEAHGFDEVSLCDFVLHGGEVAALAVIEACVRLLPGVLGNSESLRDESFSDGLLQYAQYTKPEIWRGRTVPEPLLRGDHAAIKRWRRRSAVETTRKMRADLESPDLYGDD